MFALHPVAQPRKVVVTPLSFPTYQPAVKKHTGLVRPVRPVGAHASVTGRPAAEVLE
jgi:hypothetical protein